MPTRPDTGTLYIFGVNRLPTICKIGWFYAAGQTVEKRCFECSRAYGLPFYPVAEFHHRYAERVEFFIHQRLQRLNQSIQGCSEIFLISPERAAALVPSLIEEHDRQRELVFA
jgi:hypothetical protein